MLIASAVRELPLRCRARSRPLRSSSATGATSTASIRTRRARRDPLNLLFQKAPAGWPCLCHNSTRRRRHFSEALHMFVDLCACAFLRRSAFFAYLFEALALACSVRMRKQYSALGTCT
eukprot:6064300-Pleurochrysis_carterae.AAC.2